MNERLKELAEQAWDTTAVSPNFGHPVSFAEKLSKLIVQECCTRMALEIMDHYVDDAVKNTYEHFGIEE
jgi:hypothetical protein